MKPIRLPMQNGFLDLLQAPDDKSAYNATYSVASGGECRVLFGKMFYGVPTPEDAKALGVAWVATCYLEMLKERTWLKKNGLI